MSVRKLFLAALFAGATALPMSSANAFFGSWAPWNWGDDWYDYPYYGGYPGWGYPGYGWGGYPGYYGGYPGYYGGYPGYGWGGYPGYGGWGPWY